MIQINYSVRPFIKPNGQVAIRVRWNTKKCEVTFITGAYAEPQNGMKTAIKQSVQQRMLLEACPSQHRT